MIVSRLLTTSGWLVTSLLSGGLLAAEPYRDFKTVSNELENFARQHRTRAQLESYGNSAGGKPLHWLRVAAPGELAPDARPAIFVGANIAGYHHAGSEAALDLIRHLLSTQDARVQQLLQRRTFYIAPVMNPDAHDALFTKPRRLQAANAQALDADVDGLTGEDGGNDLNGDGVIGSMRIRDPRGNFIVDPDDPRRMMEADASKGQRGEYLLVSEGDDDDRDGAFNEDAPTGIVLDRSFPAGFVVGRPEHGAWPGLAPETKAIMDQLLKHKNINFAVVYGPANQLLEPPKGYERITPPGAKPAAEAHKPEDDDLKTLATLGERYRQALTDAGFDGKRHARQTAAGSFSTWLYFHYGVQTLELDVWGPDKTPVKKPPGTETATETAATAQAGAAEKSGAAEKAGAANGKAVEASAGADKLVAEKSTMEKGAGEKTAGEKTAGEKNGAEKSGAEKNGDKAAAEKRAAEKALIAFLEQHNPDAIRPWTPVKLADGRQAEVGGIDPHAEYLPPMTVLQKLLPVHHEQVLNIADEMADLELLELQTEQQADDVWRVRAVAGVRGRLPTHTALAARMKNRLPVNMSISYDAAVQPLTLNNRVFSERLDSRGKLEGEWWVNASRGKKVTVTVWTPHNGRASKNVVLGEEN